MRKSMWWVVVAVSVSLFFMYACEEDPTSPSGETDTNQTDTSDTDTSDTDTSDTDTSDTDTSDTDTSDTTGNSAGERTYWEAESYSGVCENYDGDDFMPFNLTYPTPGDSFKVGDTVVLGICYEPDEGKLAGETVTLIKEEDGTDKSLEIASLADDDMSEEQIRKMENGKFVWTIPESFPEEEGGTSVVGDSLYLVLRTYVGMFPSQEEYGPFKITE